MPLIIDVVGGLVRDGQGRYLITQRRRGSHLEGLWEFPGGKIEAGESPEAALRRELTEELGATFVVGKLFETVHWEYPDREVLLRFYDCRVESGVVEPREGQAMEWVRPGDLTRYQFPPADRELIARLTSRG